MNCKPERKVVCGGKDAACPEWCDKQRPHAPNRNCEMACSVHPKTSICIKYNDRLHGQEGSEAE